MTDRLTTEEIQDLRAKSAAATKGWRPGDIDGNVDYERGFSIVHQWVDGGGFWCEKDRAVAIAARNTLDRLLDELLEHREREAAEIAGVLGIRIPMPAAKETDR